MYTKILLLVALSIIVSSSVSIDNYQVKMAFYIEKTSDNNLTHSGDQQNNENLPFGIDWSLPHQDTSKHTNQNSDDDGKSHHFHFEHFTHRRRDILFHAFARFILLLSFISSLISGFFMWNC